jgi:hypothetical protein
MELVTQADVYSPIVDENGNYTDKIPFFGNLQHGIKCPCGSRKEKAYETHTIFSQHTKTKSHQKWLQTLNTNKANYYVECEKLQTIVRQQQLIIARLEKQVQSKSLTIDFLTQQLVAKTDGDSKEVNLLDF